MVRLGFRDVALWGRGLIERNAQYTESRIWAFSLVAVIAFPLYYVVWHDFFPQPYENLPLRVLGSVIFMPFLFIKYWPQSVRRYLSLYWFFAILFGLPFFFTFMLLENGGSTAWLLSALAAVFIMTLVLDWVNVLVQFGLGAGCAVLVFYLVESKPLIGQVPAESIPIYFFVILLGSIANYSFERLQRERQRAMLVTVSNIAHELRTPLLGIKTGAAGLRQYLPALMDGYMRAKECGLAVQPVRQVHLDAMRGVLERIEGEASHSNTVIDMLLMNARQDEATRQTTVVGSISQCVQTALARYPFSSDKERELVVWEGGADFSFRGNELLMEHVLFNLLKNALYHIAKAGKGEVVIRLERGAQGNVLRFRDSGPGIPPEVLPNVFTRFYSWSSDRNSSSGAGVGLAFCRSVMNSFGGKIAAESALGEYTEFVLTFPSEGAA